MEHTHPSTKARFRRAEEERTHDVGTPRPRRARGSRDSSSRGLPGNALAEYVLDMRFAVLGPLEVWSDEAPVTIAGAKERLLLAVLASAAPGVVSTDRLVESLWNGPA